MARKSKVGPPSGATSASARTHDTGAQAAGSTDRQRERFGGINWGAAFFGWLVAVAVAILLTSIAGAVAAAVGYNTSVTQSQAERQAGTIGIAAAVVLLVVLLVAYYTGGYVAGRMSRFDGGKQGLAVWVIGLLVTIAAVLLGVVFGSQYDILNRVNLPTIPVPTEALSWGGAITAAAVVLGTLLAAMAGGKVGQRYHSKVDRAAYS
jgi:amino acid transporter